VCTLGKKNLSKGDFSTARRRIAEKKPHLELNPTEKKKAIITRGKPLSLPREWTHRNAIKTKS